MLIFLKLGGSLITNKDIPFSARKKTIKRLGKEIALAIEDVPDLKLLIGHGSGSFGHSAASQFGTRFGILENKDWFEYQKVWLAAHQLNQLVINIFSKLGLPVVSLPASAALVSKKHKVEKWVIEPIIASLENNLLPIVFGDVVIDMEIGTTIYSTEDLFSHLAAIIHPDRILLAGLQNGVYKDYPICRELITSITPNTYPTISKYINGSASTDVTGGMASKVQKMLSVVEKEDNLSIHIFSGEKSGNLYTELSGLNTGTRLSL